VSSSKTESQNKWSKEEVWTGIGIFLVVLVAIGLVCLFVFYMFWVTHVENYELAFAFDRVTGKIERIDKQGWIVRTPFRYAVHHVDLRPYQLTISANQRVLNAKLVRFNPEGLETFVEWHGRSAGDSSFGLQEILKCYAFDLANGKDCPFLEVIQEIAPMQGAVTPHNVKLEKVDK